MEMNWLVKSIKNIVEFWIIDRSLIAMSTLTGCVCISAYASLVGIPIWITSSTTELKNCVIKV